MGKTRTGKLTPDEVRALKAEIERQRGSSAPFEIALGSGERDADWEKDRARIRALAEAGATWWMEYVHPGMGGLQAMRAAIARGPLRVE